MAMTSELTNKEVTNKEVSSTEIGKVEEKKLISDPIISASKSDCESKGFIRDAPLCGESKGFIRDAPLCGESKGFIRDAPLCGESKGFIRDATLCGESKGFIRDATLCGESLYSIDDELKKSQELKDQGNELFKMGEFKKSLAKYTRIFFHVNAIIPSKIEGMDESTVGQSGMTITPQQAKLAREIKSAANLNCAQAYSKLGQYRKALTFLEKLLNDDKDNKKAIYRRGQIYLNLDEFDKAETDLRDACVAFPNNKDVAADMERLMKKLSVERAKDTAKAKKMFGGIFTKRA